MPFYLQYYYFNVHHEHVVYGLSLALGSFLGIRYGTNLHFATRARHFVSQLNR